MSRLDDLVAAGAVQRDVPMAALTTYKFGGPARWFTTASTAGEVVAAIEAAIADSVSYLVVGRGSNLVISDAGFDGLVLKMAGDLASMEIGQDRSVKAGAAMPLPKLARACAKAGLGGLEFLVAVPGSVGGAVRMNAGCHGSDTGEWLTGIEVYRPGSGLIELDRAAIDMTYRSNSLPSDDVIITAFFRTEARSSDESEEIMRSITAWRKEHQPGGTFNAGSVFKNPFGTSAGQLIDSLGLKGLQVGGAKVSPRHANFFEAAPDTSAQDLYDLVETVRSIVSDQTGVVLEPEIRFIGDFIASPARSMAPSEGDQS